MEIAAQRRGCIAGLPPVCYDAGMKTLTVRLPEALASVIAAESQMRRVSKSDVVRERLQRASGTDESGSPDPVADIRDLIGSVKGLARDLSGRKKHHLKAARYGQNRAR
jgi:Arc/MetJ-type ribon-helix-helix transcriptional regulator